MSVKRLLYKFLLEKLFRFAVYVQLAFFSSVSNYVRAADAIYHQIL